MRLALLLLISVELINAQPRFYDDDPLLKSPTPRNVEKPKRRKISDYYDYFLHTFTTPGDQRPIPALGANTLGEVPDSEWYVNRHFFHPMTIAQLAAGPGNAEPPSTDGPWTVTRAKTEGVTPGFTIVDSKQRSYIIKFDPADYPELATAADVIGSKIFHALGYHVPENYIIHFRPDQLTISPKATLTDNFGKRRAMTSRDLTDILLRVSRESDGRIRASASRYLAGDDLGPYRYFGTRADDPNDTIPHEHRRELRGLRIFSAWVDHDDSRAINTLDMLVKDNGRQYIRHHLIDFGSIFGSASYGPNSPRSGNEYVFSWRPPAKQFFTLGLWVPKWARADYPELPSVGRFESKVFDPVEWVPEYPNPAFVNMQPQDAYWAARQVAAFTDDQIRAMVNTGEYSNPAAEKWIIDCLIERRDKIAKAYLNGAEVLPLDHFAIRNGELTYKDLGNTKTAHEVRWFTFNNQTNTRAPIPNASTFRIPKFDTYAVAVISAPNSKPTVAVYLRNRAGALDIVGIDR